MAARVMTLHPYQNETFRKCSRGQSDSNLISSRLGCLIPIRTLHCDHFCRKQMFEFEHIHDNKGGRPSAPSTASSSCKRHTTFCPNSKPRDLSSRIALWKGWAAKLSRIRENRISNSGCGFFFRQMTHNWKCRVSCSSFV